MSGQVKYTACVWTLLPLQRFYWVAQSNWETTFCCSPSQNLFLETLGYGKKVGNCGTWGVTEGYPNETWVWEQPSPTNPMSQKTWSKLSPQHETPPLPTWAFLQGTRIWYPIWRLTPGHGGNPSLIHLNEWMYGWMNELLYQSTLHAPWQTWTDDVKWKKCSLQVQSTVIPASLWNSCTDSLAIEGLAIPNTKTANSTVI